MEQYTRLLVHRNKSIYDNIVVSLNIAVKYEEFSRKIVQVEECFSTEHDDQCQKTKSMKIFLRKKGFNSYLVSAYVYNLIRSEIYRKSAVNLLLHFIKKTYQSHGSNVVILLKLRTPKYQFIDYGWNDRMTRMVMERQEIDHAMSWLSTLGGAFSALGDTFDRCAKVAGKISVEQFKLSMRLGDPQLVARCNLYAALSLLQQGYLGTCRRMVKKIHEFALQDKDIRLRRMCQGVWAKLKYTYSLKKSRLRKLRNSSS